VARRRLIMTGLVISGAGLFACGSPQTQSPSSSLHSLGVEVVTVTEALEPYNPQLANQGIPAEEVTFEVTGVSGPFSCTIQVLRSGHAVGHTTVSFGSPGESPSIQESVGVDGIEGGTFNGRPSDARIECRGS